MSIAQSPIAVPAVAESARVKNTGPATPAKRRMAAHRDTDLVPEPR